MNKGTENKISSGNSRLVTTLAFHVKYYYQTGIFVSGADWGPGYFLHVADLSYVTSLSSLFHMYSLDYCRTIISMTFHFVINAANMNKQATVLIAIARSALSNGLMMLVLDDRHHPEAREKLLEETRWD